MAQGCGSTGKAKRDLVGRGPLKSSPLLACSALLSSGNLEDVIWITRFVEFGKLCQKRILQLNDRESEQN